MSDDEKVVREEHGSDICYCGDYRSQHKVLGRCGLCGCALFHYAHASKDRSHWEKYHGADARSRLKGFEEWWIANGPSEGNASFRRMCSQAWNAALASLGERPAELVSDAMVEYFVKTACGEFSIMARELQQYRAWGKEAEQNEGI